MFKKKILVKYHNPKCKIESYGNWMDLKSAETVLFDHPSLTLELSQGTYMDRQVVKFDSKLISLGLSMKLPKYYEANIVPRSSLYLKKNIIQGNHFGIIDTSYCGNGDIWKFPAIALKRTQIDEGERICQFRIELSSNASIFAKIMNLFTTFEFVEVDDLKSINRGGFGSSGGYKQ